MPIAVAMSGTFSTLGAVTPFPFSFTCSWLRSRTMLASIQRWANQFAVGESFCWQRALGWNGVDCVFHGTTCSTRFYAGHNPKRLMTVDEGVNFQLT
jgi:hypothetical protein